MSVLPFGEYSNEYSQLFLFEKKSGIDGFLDPRFRNNGREGLGHEYQTEELANVSGYEK